MRGKKGLYEMILAFFSATVLIVAVLFFVYLNTASSSLYALTLKGTQAPQQASLVKDAVLSCHRIDYIEESKINEPCRADSLMKGYKIVQLSLNGCEEKTWDKSRGEFTSSIPFVIAVQQQSSSKKCLARLEVLA